MADPDVEMIGDQQNLQLNVDQLQRMLSLLRKNGLKVYLFKTEKVQ
jgi:hypothetical protein